MQYCKELVASYNLTKVAMNQYQYPVFFPADIAVWQERSQFKLPPDDVMQSFPALRVLTQRQQEILYLKGLKQFPDKEFRVIDLSQTLMFCNMVKDKVPCITPAGQKFLTACAILGGVWGTPAPRNLPGPPEIVEVQFRVQNGPCRECFWDVVLRRCIFVQPDVLCHQLAMRGQFECNAPCSQRRCRGPRAGIGIEVELGSE